MLTLESWCRASRQGTVMRTLLIIYVHLQVHNPTTLPCHGRTDVFHINLPGALREGRSQVMYLNMHLPAFLPRWGQALARHSRNKSVPMIGIPSVAVVQRLRVHMYKYPRMYCTYGYVRTSSCRRGYLKSPSSALTPYPLYSTIHLMSTGRPFLENNRRLETSPRYFQGLDPQRS